MSGTRGRRGTVVVLVLATLLALAPGPVVAEELDLGSVVVRHTSSSGSLHGYRELVFDLVSRSNLDQEVTLRLPDGELGYFGSIERLERTVHLPAGQEIRVRLHQPPLQLADPWLRVAVDGRLQPGRLGLGHSHPEAWTGGGRLEPRVLLSRQLFDLSADGGLLDGHAEATVDPESVHAWSPDWLAYSGWDGVVLSTDEARQAPHPVAEALIAYVEAGGTLWLVGSSILADLGTPWTTIGCEPTPPDVACSLGLGQVFRSDTREGMMFQGRPPVVEAWDNTLGFWSIAFDPARIHRELPVVDKVGVPVRGLFLLLVGFTIVVGPINFLFLSRRGQRTRILGTIPLLSLLACCALLVGVLYGEGIVRERRLDGFTWLDQTTQRTVSLGVAGYYSTLVPRAGLRFESTTEVSLFRDLQNWSLLRKRPGKQIVWDDGEGGGQHLSRGWLRPRVPTYLLLRKSERRRERLDVTLEDGVPTVVNGLGADVEALWLADAEGRLWSTGDLAVGRQATLESLPKWAEGGPDALRKAFHRTDFSLRLGEMTARPEALLEAGTYLARLESSPFLEAGLADASATERLWLVGRWRDRPSAISLADGGPAESPTTGEVGP